jgi:argininosuccinate lyase
MSFRKAYQKTASVVNLAEKKKKKAQWTKLRRIEKNWTKIN